MVPFNRFCLAGLVSLTISFWALQGWASDLTQHYVELILSKKFTQLETELTQLENSKKKNTDGIYVFFQATRDIGEDLARDPESSLTVLNVWCEQKNSYLSYLSRGRFYLEFAWADRGKQFANEVLPEVWHIFEDRLKLAQKDLEQAAVLNSNSAEPYIALMSVFRGLSLPEKIEENFNKAVFLDKNHLGAYSVMLPAKMEKWFGSNEAMFAFAEKSYQEHKDDPAFVFLLLTSYDELASRLALQTNGERSDYYNIPGNYDKVRSLCDQVLQAYPNSIKAQTYLAVINFFTGRYKEILEQIKVMGEDVDEGVWGSRESYLKTKAWLEQQHSKGQF